ncbi:MAG: F0F1 ATP synthase subunit B [Candidatus Cloacimonetes bacterium]|nr:F0F1 ATP synthase subunit B [Candidatus Cloacimonadota bacterium]
MTIDISLIAVILNFVLLLICLNAILYKPLKGFLSDRQKKIQDDIEEANQASIKANKLAEEREGELKNAIEEARKIKDTIRHEAENQAENILKAAKEQERDIVSQTENKLKTMGKNAMKDLEIQLTEIVADLTGKILSEKIDDTKDKELINKLITKRGQR